MPLIAFSIFYLGEIGYTVYNGRGRQASKASYNSWGVWAGEVSAIAGEVGQAKLLAMKRGVWVTETSYNGWEIWAGEVSTIAGEVWLVRGTAMAGE